MTKRPSHILFLALFFALSILDLHALPLDPVQKSLVIPSLQKALKAMLDQKSSADPATARIIGLLQGSHVSRGFLQRLSDRLDSKASQKSLRPPFVLPRDDQGDRAIQEWSVSQKAPQPSSPRLAVHAFKLEVIEEDDDWGGDDIYLYFFVTDGVIPTGKVTNIYRRNSAGQSFFLDQTDRVLFPGVGLPARAPSGHLIIDYGIVESEGRDIEDLKKISSVIIDLALAVYAVASPPHAAILVNLRKEVKNLAELLVGLDQDDRLATHSLYYQADGFSALFNGRTYFEVGERHRGKNGLSEWDYLLTFRFLMDK